MDESQKLTLTVENISVKLHDVCRVCLLDESEGQIEIYNIDDVYVQRNSVEHLNSFRDILSIFVNDEFGAHSGDLLPKSICIKCAARAKEAYQFIEQCQRSDKFLEQCFKIVNIPKESNPSETSQDKDTAEDANDLLKEQSTASQPKMIVQGKRWYCDKCSKSFTQPQTLRRHYRIHDETGSSKKACKQCDRQFLRSDDLTRHMRTHTGERPYRCKLCSKMYKQSTELKEHMRTHSREKRLNCTECSKTFASRNGLYVHLKQHRGEKPHACPHCSKRFKTSSERISHVVHIHKPRK